MKLVKVLFKTLDGCTRFDEVSMDSGLHHQDIRVHIHDMSNNPNLLGGGSIKYSNRIYGFDGAGYDRDGQFLIYREKL